MIGLSVASASSLEGAIRIALLAPREDAIAISVGPRELGLVAERVPTPGTHAKFVAGLIDLVSERTADNTIIERPSTTDLGPWYDVCRPNCCANRRGEKPTVAGADSTVGLPETEQA